MPTSELDCQVTIMSALHALESSNHEEFCALLPIQRRQVLRETAKREVERLSERGGVPWNLDAADWGEMALLAVQLADAEPTDAVGVLKESGVPLLDDQSTEPAPVDYAAQGDFLSTLREVGVPTTAHAVRGEASMTPLDALTDSRVPLREGMIDPAVPHHVLAKNLDAVIASDHPHRSLLDGLIAKGAALSDDDKTTVDALTAFHGDALRDSFDDLDDSDMPESASSLSTGTKRTEAPSSSRELAAGYPADHPTASVGSLSSEGQAFAESLAQHGVPIKGLDRRSEPEDEPQSTLSPVDVLRDCGVSLR